MYILLICIHTHARIIVINNKHIFLLQKSLNKTFSPLVQEARPRKWPRCAFRVNKPVTTVDE